MTEPTYYGNNVRTRTAYDAQRQEDAEIVEVKKGAVWIEQRRYGHMSNDYALTDARLCAQDLARNYIGGH